MTTKSEAADCSITAEKWRSTQVSNASITPILALRLAVNYFG
jgi:hypothetical protein